MLGGGSNVLVADAGIRGLVLRPRGGHIDARGRSPRARRRRRDDQRAGALVDRPRPGRSRGMGGNAGDSGRGHLRQRALGRPAVVRVRLGVRLASTQGTVSDVAHDAMEFGYDRSRLQRTGEILLSAVFAVSPGESAQLRETARASLAYRKRTQPLWLPSAGCIFQNPVARRRAAVRRSGVGGRAHRQGRAQGRGHRRGRGLAHARELHRERRHRHCRRHPRAGRPVPAGGRQAFRRDAGRRDRVSR